MENIFKVFFIVFPFTCFLLMAQTNGTVIPEGETHSPYFTNAIYMVPPKAADWPEVKDLFKEDVFKDVHEHDEESVLRRFEIVFFISMPATLLLNTAILTVIQTFETGIISMPEGNSRMAYLYGGAVLMSVGIAMEDYRNVRKKREAQGLQWEFIRKRF